MRRIAKIMFSSDLPKIKQGAFAECSGDLKIFVESKHQEKYQVHGACSRNIIKTIPEKLAGERFMDEHINAINEMPFDDRVHFLSYKSEDRNIVVVFKETQKIGVWTATSISSNNNERIVVRSTEPCEMLIELMKKYELQAGTPMRNICPLIMPTSYQEKSDEGGDLPNYIVLAINDLVVKQKARAKKAEASEVAAEAVGANSTPSLFGGPAGRRIIRGSTGGEYAQIKASQ